MQFWKEHTALRMVLMLLTFVLGLFLLIYGWRQTGQMGGLLLMLAVMIFVGLRGNKMYMKHCVRTVRQVKAANLADEPNMTLDARGGVNPSIAVCIFVCYFLLVNVVPLLL